jgi:hypothetical protein
MRRLTLWQLFALRVLVILAFVALLGSLEGLLGGAP